ncbi:MAG: AI-2E family transporter, partial [Planctomycetales bacterium]|nr:AI-2E family transporter [Planctomycetales bacterium]
MAKRSLDSATSKLLTLVGTALAVLSLYFAKEILLPFFLAIFLSFILHPLARGLERFRVPRAAAVLTVMLLACGMIGSIGWLVTNQVIDLSGKLPEYKGNLIEKVRAVKGATRGRIQRASQTIEEIGKELAGDNAPEGTRAGTSNGGTGNEMAVGEGTTDESQRRADHSPIFDYLVRSGLSMGDREQDNGDAVEVKVVSLPPSPLTQFQTWLGPLVAPLTTAGVVLVLTLFLLLQREKMRNRVLQLVGSGNLRTATEALDDITRRVSNLLRMQLLVNSLYGVSVGVGLYLIGVPNAILWGILGLLLRFLPYVGPWIVAIMPISLSMAVFD